MSTPASLASPRLGGPAGRHLGRPDRGFVLRTRIMVFVLLGLNVLAGVLRQSPCLEEGYAIPHASHRMCASPLANALGGTTFPVAPGRAQGSLAAMSPLDTWFVSIGSALGSPAGAMGLVLIINAVAFAVAGIALMRLFPRYQWLALMALSPLVLFGLGQSLDPVGLAAVLVAIVFVEQWNERGYALVWAGILMALGVLANPLAVLAVLAVIIHLYWTHRGSDAYLLVGSTAIVLGLALMLDGRSLPRLQAWFGDAIDRGSLASILAQSGLFANSLITVISLLAWAAALVATVIIMGRYRAGITTGTPKTQAGDGTQTGANPGAGADYAVLATLFFAASLVLLPAAPLSQALWLLPFAVMTVHNVWVHAGWMFAEAALFIAINLGDVFVIEQAKGLAPTWVMLLTVLRLITVGLIAFWAAVGTQLSALTGGAQTGIANGASARAKPADTASSSPHLRTKSSLGLDTQSAKQ